MKTIYWFSRHLLTNGQTSTLKSYYGDNITVEQHNIIFNDNIVQQIEEITDQKVISVVVTFILRSDSAQIRLYPDRFHKYSFSSSKRNISL